MGDHSAIFSQRVSNQPIVCNLEKRTDGRWIIAATARPPANVVESWDNCTLWSQEKPFAPFSRPSCKLITACVKFVTDFLDTGNSTCFVLFNQPLPERRTEIEAVVQILGLYENVRIEQVGCQSTTPTSRPNLLKVEVLEIPSMRKASRYSV